MQKTTRILPLALTLSLLTACGATPKQTDGIVQHDPEESALYLTTDPPSMTIHARMINEEDTPTEDIYLHFDVVDEELQDVIDYDAIATDGEEFSISAEGSYVVNASFPLSEPIEEEHILTGIEAYVEDDEGNEIYRFTFEHAETD